MSSPLIATAVPSPCGPIVLDYSVGHIYDIFLTNHGTELCVLGPGYARKSMILPDAVFNGHTSVTPTFDDDPWLATMVMRFAIPQNAKHVALKIYTRDIINIPLPPHQPDASSGLVCCSTMAKFDWPYVGEWIDYHRGIGIGHFFIYNNNEPRLSEALRPFVESGIVTEYLWPYGYKLYPFDWLPTWPTDSHIYAQIPAQMHTLLRHGDNWKWVGFFDCDEFINPSSMPLVDVLHHYDSASCIYMKGRWFGNSRHRDLQLPVLDSYTRCEHEPSASLKYFVRPHRVKQASIHFAKVYGKTITRSTLTFNHYRSISKHHDRCGPQFDGEFTNDVEDVSILKWRRKTP